MAAAADSVTATPGSMSAAANASSSSSSNNNASNSSPSAGDASTPLASLKMRTTNADSCLWYADSKCTKPRTCFDCLNIGIPSGECAIDPRGRCVTMAEYQSFAKARNYYYPNYKYYPSDNYTYCSALDVTCQTCKQKWIQDYNSIGNTPAIPFCTGDGGCVCVAYCELPGWADTVIGNECSSTSADEARTTKLIGAIALSSGICVLFLAIAIGVRYLVQRLEWNAVSRRERSRAPLGPQLALDGWKSMRQKLIESERHHIEGREALAPRLVADDNAPVVVLEEGEGFRPASPSELERQRAAASDRSQSSTMSASSNSRDRGGGVSDVTVPPALKTWTNNARDSCTWYAGVSCGSPRSCFDCLNVQIVGTKCAVDPGGACVSIDKYEEFMAHRERYPSSYSYYVSANASYCRASDPICAECRAKWIANTPNMSVADSCVGVDGCVCVVQCELPDWRSSVTMRSNCNVTMDRKGAVYKLLTALAIGLGMCAVFVIIALGVRSLVQFLVQSLEARAEATRSERELERRRLRRREPSGPQLSLDGWKAMCEKLIEKDREHLAGGDPSQSLSTDAPAALSTSAAVASTAAVVVVVEDGDAFLPLSPSELRRQRSRER